MTETYISSLQNQQVKAWRALKEAKGRAAQRLFLAEGDHMAGEALTARAAKALLVGESACERFAGHMQAAHDQRRSVYIMADHVMEALCDARTPQGIIAVCGLPDTGTRVPDGKLKLAALDGVQDPGNVGTVLRTLDAAGFDALLTDRRTADPYGPKALRASMGAVFRVPVYSGSLPEMLEAISHTHDLYAGALDGKPFFERERSRPGVCVIIGNEGAGISPAVYAVSGIRRVKLPMVGGAESLNASVAGAIMIYDIVRCGK
ncbi:MAG: RNA methyltransferase [Clostridia bacterium]|nr:RNA methyltransferase [Clostridia bacterium]